MDSPPLSALLFLLSGDQFFCMPLLPCTLLHPHTPPLCCTPTLFHVLPCTVLHPSPCAHVFAHTPLLPRCFTHAAPPFCYTAACCCTYVCVLTCIYLYTLHPFLPLLSPPALFPRPCLADYRLEEQLTKATLVTDNAKGSCAHSSKCGCSPSLSPESQGQSGRHHTIPVTVVLKWNATDKISTLWGGFYEVVYRI